MHYLNRRREKKVLSLSTCQTSEPHNDLALGEAIGRAVRRYEGRVLFVASGGLSHKFHKFDRIVETRPADLAHIWSPVNREMDQLVMNLMREGRHRELIELAPSYRAACMPEANFAHYLMLAGAHGGTSWTAKGTQYGQYENAIGTGQANFWFDA